MPGPIAFVLVFSLLIFVHELGHFFLAKLHGVRVDEFGFGYPPRLVKLGTWRGTEVTLNALPIGGFVRMSEDDPTVDGSLASKNRRTRALVYAAGAAMNLLLAVVLYIITFLLGAWTAVDGPGAGVYFVSPQSPAYEAGLRPGDTILAVNGATIADAESLVSVVRANLGQPIVVTARRDTRPLPPMTMTPRVSPPPNEGAIGVSPGRPIARHAYPIWEAVPRGVAATWNTMLSLFYGIRAMVRKEIPVQISGPIGIYQATTEVAKTGLDRLIEFTAFLSINLFMVNLLPLPALDGGRLIFVALEWARRGRRVPPEKEGLVHTVGMIVLIALMAVVTVFDYQRYFG
ncbi:MAG: M50 family metallopeptidase [Chloroflexota bacterium]